MQVQSVVDLDHGIMAENPLAVETAGCQLRAVLKISERVLRFPVSAIVARVLFAKGLFTHFLRILISICGKFGGRDIPEIAIDVHGFVISDERVHGSAGRGCLLLQSHQEVHTFTRLRAPIEHIPRLHQVRLATGPVSLVINELGGLEHCDQLSVISVKVAHCDHPFDIAPDTLG